MTTITTTDTSALVPHIDCFLDRCRDTLTPGSIDSYRGDLQAMCQCLAAVVAPHRGAGGVPDISELHTGHLKVDALTAALHMFAAGAFRQHGVDAPRATRTVQRAWSVVTNLCTDLCTRGVLPGNPMSGIPRLRSPAKTRTRLNDDEAKALITAAAAPPPPRLAIRWPQRDVAIVTAFLALGIRLNELLTLTVGDLTGNQRTPLLWIDAGGHYERLQPVPPVLAERLADYFHDRHLVSRERRPSSISRHRLPLAGLDDTTAAAFVPKAPLFVTTHGTKFDRGQVHRVIERIFEQADLPASTYAASGKVQILRATSAWIHRDGGASFEEVHALMGNYSWDATRAAVYDDRTQLYSIFSRDADQSRPPATRITPDINPTSNCG